MGHVQEQTVSLPEGREFLTLGKSLDLQTENDLCWPHASRVNLTDVVSIAKKEQWQMGLKRANLEIQYRLILIFPSNMADTNRVWSP